jgi:23S rRNA pseudouridine1911/1915/1917 synthase
MKYFDNAPKKWEILYEDNHLIAVVKPAGMLTQPSGTDQDSLEKNVKAWIKEKYHKPGEVFLHALHRLDRPASGIVLFARTSKALSRLQSSLKNKQTVKKYYAWVEGDLPSKEGHLENYLYHDEYHARVVSPQHKDAKLAKLHYQVVERMGGSTLLDITLETGRYHQIRCQLSHLGHPILGDAKYGSKMPFREGAIALHHYCFEISHPVGGRVMQFISNL